MGKKTSKSIGGTIVKYIVIMFIVILGYQSLKLMRVSRTLDNQIEMTEKEIEKEDQKLQVLKEEHDNLDSIENIEELARDNLGLVKEDEIVFRMKENTK